MQKNTQKNTPPQTAEGLVRETEISGLVYDSLMGQLIPACRLDWVEDIFQPGTDCYEAYRQVREALETLDAEDDRLLNALLDYSRIVGTEMFAYGRRYQQMLDSMR